MTRPDGIIEALPPQSLGAEEGVLAALLVDPDRLEEVRRVLRPVDFYQRTNRLIFEAIVALADRGEPIDVITVRGELERTGDLDEVGGSAALAALTRSSGSSVHAAAYAKTVARKATARNVIQVAGEIAGLAYSESPELLDQAQIKLLTAAFSSYEDDAAQFTRKGLGYVGVFPPSIKLEAHGLRWSGGELHAELHVTVGGLAIHRARFNLSSTTARTTLAKTLSARSSTKVDWTRALEQLCQHILGEERRGEPFERVGRLARRQGTRYLLYPMMPVDEPTLLFADGGTGKSYLAVAIACSVQAGIPILPGFDLRKKGPVLYLDWETSRDEINERVQAVCAGAGIEPVEFFYRRCTTALTDQVEEVAGLIAQEGIALVVADSLGFALGQQSERGSAEETAIRFFTAVRHLKTTVLGIDHLKKEDAQSKGGPLKPYGSGYKVNAARSTWSVRKQNDVDGDLILENQKLNNGRRAAPVGLRATFEENEDGLTTKVTYSPMEVVDTGTALPSINLQTSQQAMVREYLDTIRRPAGTEEIAQETGLAKERVSTYAGRLVEQGHAYRHSRGVFVTSAIEEGAA